MAFRELTTDELELLTEEKRKVYEEELDIYQQRVRFVEQLEKTENMQIEPFKPTLNRIPAVKTAPEKQFEQQEHHVQKVTVAKKKMPRTLMVSVAPIEDLNVPKLSGLDMPQVDSKKIETQSPVMPIGKKPRIPAAKAMPLPAQGVKAEDLGLEGPKIPSVIPVKPQVVSAAVPAVTKPRAVQIVSANSVDVQAVKAPAISVRKPTAAPVVAVPEKDYKATLPAAVKQLAAAPVVAAPAADYKAVLPAAVKQPVAPVVAAAVIENINPELPAVTMKVKQVKARRIGAPRMSDLPVVPTCQVAEVDFRQPQCQKPAAVSVKKAVVPDAGKFHTPTVRPEAAVPAVPKVRVSEPKITNIEVKDVAGSMAPLRSAMEVKAASVRSANSAKAISALAARELNRCGLDNLAVPAPVTVPDPYANAFVKALLQSAFHEAEEGASA